MILRFNQTGSPLRFQAMARNARCLLLTCVAALGIHGCSRQSNEDSSSATVDGSAGQTESAGTIAKRELREGHYDAAAEHVYQALISEGESEQLILLAAQIEAARGDAEACVDLLRGIDLESAKESRIIAQLLVEQAAKVDDASVVESTLRAMIRREPAVDHWRRQLWRHLQAGGRFQEASQQADVLCRMGAATTDELISLIRRNEVFPTPKIDAVIDPNRFVTPLARSKWYVARSRFDEASDELAGQAESGFSDAASAALYLRILAERQNTDQFIRVLADCSPEAQLHADYWCAFGLIFIDRSEYDVAVGLLLKAVSIDPTMRIAFQRLSRCFHALGRDDDGEQFRHRGIQLAETETIGRRILEDPANTAARSDLARSLLELGRPLEALNWTLTAIPASATQNRAIVARKLAETAALPEVDQIPSTVALLSIDPAEFPYVEAVKNALRQSQSPPADRPGAVVRQPSATPRLVNVALKRGADFQWYRDLELADDAIALFQSVGGGIAVLDYDLDGWPDLYFAQGSGRPPDIRSTRSSELRRNLDGVYSVVTSQSGTEDYQYSSGVAAGDVNQDGFPDLYLGALQKNRLLINNGDGTFRDATEQISTPQDFTSTSLAIADINGDHLPDLFEVNYIESEGAFAQPNRDAEGNDELPSPLLFLPQADRMFLARGDGTFTKVDVTTDIAKPATGLGIMVSDIDNVPGNEIFVGNDLRPNHLLRWRDGRLMNVADAKGIANGYHGLANGCMGIATGDFDRNGTLDLHVTNYRDESDNLYLQSKDGMFRDAAALYGLRPLTFPYVAFGTKAIDLDRNGWLDFMVTNGHIFDMSQFQQGFKMPPQVMMASGEAYQLAEVDDPSGYWSGRYLGRAMAMIDFDRDHASDLVIGHLDAPTALLHNQTKTTAQNVMLELVGTTSERDAIGAKVVVHTGEGDIATWVTAGDGYFCTDEPYLDVAIPETSKIESVEVTWPTGTKTTYHGIDSGNRYLLIERQAAPYRRQM